MNKTVPTITEILKKAAEDTTGHGISRVALCKQYHLKLLWFILWLSLLCMFVFIFNRAVTRLRQEDIGTTIRASAIPFEFPDIYICNLSPISGSRPFFLDKDTASFINQIQKQIDETVNKLADDPAKIRNATKLKMLQSTLSHKFIADYLGQIQQQTIEDAMLLFDSEQEVQFTPFYHVQYGNCFKLNLTEDMKNFLQETNNGIQIGILFDNMRDSYSKGDHQIEPYYIYGKKIYPPFWDFSEIYQLYERMAIKICYASRGTYPNCETDSVLVSPGKEVQIRLTMTRFNRENLANQCIQSPPNVYYVNPYSNKLESWKYSIDTCKNELMTTFMKQYDGCLTKRMSLSKDNLHLKMCHDLAFINNSKDNFEKTMNSYYKEHMYQNVEQIESTCKNKIPCQDDFYEPVMSSGKFPNPETMMEDVAWITQSLKQDKPALWYLTTTTNKVPLIKQLFILYEKAIRNGSYVEQQFAKLELLNFYQSTYGLLIIRASETQCTEFVFKYNYIIDNFISDVGGYMGLLLGASLLTMFEVVQVIHDVITYVFFSKKGVITETNGSHKEQTAAISTSKMAIEDVEK